MSIRILVNKQMEEFVLHSEYYDSTGESNDGMRRGYSYTVHVTHTFSFENEKQEEEGYSYDLRVVKNTDDCIRNYDIGLYICNYQLSSTLGLRSGGKPF